jgi:glycerophosphoryl diester phosphodiesterase
VSAWTARRGSVLVVGHRGGRGEGWPAENTMPAFERAVSQGAKAVELDVRTCAGGEVVVFHDATLERMTQGRDLRRVEDLSADALRSILLTAGAHVPLLSEVLGWARQCDVAVNVELKHDVPNRLALAEETARVVKEAGADVLFSSFDPLLLAMVSALALAIPRALLVHADQPMWADALQAAARPPLVGALHLEHTQTGADALRRYLLRGLRLGVWTVNEPREAAALVESGVASIITDRPGDVLAGLQSA